MTNYSFMLVFVTSSYRNAFTGSSTLLSNLLLHIHIRILDHTFLCSMISPSIIDKIAAVMNVTSSLSCRANRQDSHTILGNDFLRSCGTGSLFTPKWEHRLFRSFLDDELIPLWRSVFSCRAISSRPPRSLIIATASSRRRLINSFSSSWLIPKLSLLPISVRLSAEHLEAKLNSDSGAIYVAHRAIYNMLHCSSSNFRIENEVTTLAYIRIHVCT